MFFQVYDCLLMLIQTYKKNTYKEEVYKEKNEPTTA